MKNSKPWVKIPNTIALFEKEKNHDFFQELQTGMEVILTVNFSTMKICDYVNVLFQIPLIFSQATVTVSGLWYHLSKMDMMFIN